MSRQLILLIFRIPLTFFPGKQLMFSSGFSSNFFALLTAFAPPWRLFNTNHDLCIAWQSSRACYFSIQHFFIFWFCYGANLKINGAFHIKVPMDIYGDFHGYMGIGYKCKCIQCPLHVVYLVFCSYQRFEILIRSLVQLNYSRLNAKRNDSADRSVACQAVVLSSTLLLQKHILTKLW